MMSDSSNHINTPTIMNEHLPISNFSLGLTSYLAQLGLPSEGILVPVNERLKVIKNIPDIAADLSPSQRLRAVYISKFVAACAAGLFDAALNFLWNETVTNLREKIFQFDLEYFFDSVVTDPKRRSQLKTAEDLKDLDDWELVKGCLTTGLISDLGFRHLDYIRDMRNHASAAHPNQNQLTGLQVASWLETCLREVLSKEPTGPILEVKRLLKNIRSQAFISTDIPPIETALDHLPEDIMASFSRTMFGMYGDLGIASNARNNILLVAPVAWKVSSEEIRHAAGLYYATLAANGDVDRIKLVHQLLDTVNGLSYLPKDNRAVYIQANLQRLWVAHNGFNSFYNEEPFATELEKYVPESGDIPISVEMSYIKILIMCRIGNGYGVARSAVGLYDKLLLRITPRQIALALMIHTKDSEFQTRLELTSCSQNFHKLIKGFHDRVKDPKLDPCLTRALQVPSDKLGVLGLDTAYQKSVESLNRIYK